MSARDICLTLLVILLWSGNFVAMRYGMNDLPPMLFSALRCGLPLPIALYLGRGNVPWNTIIRMALSLCIGGFGLLHLGIWLGVPPGLASLLNQSQALFVAVFAAFVFRDPPNGLQKMGLLVAAVGVGLVASTFHDRAGLWGLCSIIAAATSFAWSHIELKRAGAVDMLRLSAWTFAVSSPVFVLLSALLDTQPWTALMQISPAGLCSILYTGLFASLTAQYLWGRVMDHNPPTVVAPFVLLVPVLCFLWSALLFGEAFTLIKGIASALMFAGLCLTVFGRKHHFPWMRHSRH